MEKKSPSYSVNPITTDLNSRALPSRRHIQWSSLLFFILTALASIVFIPIHIINNGLSLGLVAFFFVCFAISNMSITCGYHRYFSHRSYDAHKSIKWLYILMGAGAFQGSILQWCTDHRRHHRAVDTDNDPYSIQKGFWYAHMGWMLVKDDHPESQKFAKDLLKDRWIRMQHDYYPWVATLVGFGFPALTGWLLGFGWWAGFMYGGVLRVVVSQHSTFFINSLCHTLGRQTYTDKNSARDSLVMAILTFGEGYHNYHHFFQADYRNGVRWYQFDPTKWWIRGLAFVGLTSRLKRVSREEIMKARLAMEERYLLSKGVCSDRVKHLKERIMTAQLQIRDLKESYLAIKAANSVKIEQHRTKSLQARRRLRAEIKMAKLEFKSAWLQWQVLRSAIA
jgi:stearoyl-CoA desaturase (delta-9 desaturase)